MDKFIRLDEIGTWKGTEHISKTSVYDGNYDEELDAEDGNVYGKMENGISCYKIYENDKTSAIEELYRYWDEVANFNLNEYKNFQVTIFEGIKQDEWGSDGEDLAICRNTIIQLDAYEFMKTVAEAKEKVEGYFYNKETDDFEEIEDEEYRQILSSLIA